MKSRRIALKAIAMLIILSMMLAACTGNTGSNNKQPSLGQDGTSEGTENSEETVTLRLLIIDTGSKWNIYPNNAIAEEIASKIGVRIEYDVVDNSKFNVLLAGGDMPDIVRTEPAKYGKQLIEGNLIIPLDDMLAQFGKDIVANIPTVVEFSKANWSEGKNQLYFLPPQVQFEPSPIYPPLTIGPTIRWDYYKEIGAPEFDTPDELLDVLEQIVDRHPQTEDGKKIYGVSLFQDWGLWPYIVPFAWYTMQSANNSDLMVKRIDETQFRNILTEEDSTFWVAVDFYNKANRRGLLDPDALTMKNNDYSAKATAGQIVLGPATWVMGDFNTKYANEGKGYVVLPVGKRAWSGGLDPLGWSGKSYAISKSSKHPEKAMQFLNYLYSYEGARTLYSGVEGIHWEMVNGKPQIKDETFKLRNAGGREWENTGIALDTNLMGIGASVLDPVTQTPLDLFQTPEALARGITTLEKDFSNYYGGLHPGDVLSKRIAEGKLQDGNTASRHITAEQRIKEGMVGLPQITEEMLKVEAQLKELAARYSARLILAKTDEEFDEIKQEALKAFKDAGADKFTEFYTNEYAKRREEVGALPARLND